MGMGLWVGKHRFPLHCKTKGAPVGAPFKTYLIYRETEANRSECSRAWNWWSSLL